jgi:hypothetical protein
MIGYDLATGSERWSAAGVPSACCSSPVIAEGVVYFAGSAGGGEGEEAQTPTFDAILKDLDADQDGAISRAEGEKPFAGFFDNQDVNKDGQISRDEWDAIIQFFAEGQNSAFALSAGGTGDVTQSHVLWKQAQGLPYIPSAIVYRGQYVLVKDGGIVTSYDVKTGVEISKPARTAAAGNYYASPVAANGHIYLLSLDGGVTVLRLEPGGPVVVTKNPELGERTAATPAIADDTIYIRTDRHLYAFAEPGSGLSVKAEDK